MKILEVGPGWGWTTVCTCGGCQSKVALSLADLSDVDDTFQWTCIVCYFVNTLEKSVVPDDLRLKILP